MSAVPVLEDGAVSTIGPTLRIEVDDVVSTATFPWAAWNVRMLVEAFSVMSQSISLMRETDGTRSHQAYKFEDGSSY